MRMGVKICVVITNMVGIGSQDAGGFLSHGQSAASETFARLDGFSAEMGLQRRNLYDSHGPVLGCSCGCYNRCWWGWCSWDKMPDNRCAAGENRTVNNDRCDATYGTCACWTRRRNYVSVNGNSMKYAQQDGGKCPSDDQIDGFPLNQI